MFPFRMAHLRSEPETMRSLMKKETTRFTVHRKQKPVAVPKQKSTAQGKQKQKPSLLYVTFSQLR